MALKILQAGIEPLGQFDGLDADVTTVKGGEVVCFTYVSIVGTDKHASDVNDGYVSSTTLSRPAVTKSLSSGARPLFLVDDGTVGYGTLFGVVVGGASGQVSFGPSSTIPSGSILGPHTALGSGKLTLWDKPGLYAVTLDAVDTTAATGLVPTNTTLAGGSPLYATTAGLLTPNAGAAFEAIIVARFLEFSGTGSLVTTPVDLVNARNSPTGNVSSVVQKPFTQAVIHFAGSYGG
ncbi:MAG TPA: hypothetical protein VM577_14125 [Anaerovoracaceae bacterium]|nr:hypothetical protein [Anaerovoracaceae bacterium]